MLRPGRHSGMTATELEGIILRSGDFLWVHRAGSGGSNSIEDSTGGLYHGVSGEFIMGVGGGYLPEYSRMLELHWDCPCTPNGTCRTGAHGRRLKRGWRNILYELLARKLVRPTKEVRCALGDEYVERARIRGMEAAPMEDTAPAWNHSQLQTAV